MQLQSWAGLARREKEFAFRLRRAGSRRRGTRRLWGPIGLRNDRAAAAGRSRGGRVQLGPSGGCRRGNGGHSGKCSGGGGDGHSDAGEDAGVMVATDVERGGSLRSVQKVRWMGLSDS